MHQMIFSIEKEFQNNGNWNLPLVFYLQLLLRIILIKVQYMLFTSVGQLKSLVNV